MTCLKCKNGLIPFVKAGKVVSNAYLHCSCHPVYGDNPAPEHYRELSPADIDYPCSDIFRGYSYQYCGQPDPGYIPPEPEPEAPAPREIIHRHSDMSKKDFALLQDLARQVKYLQEKLTERTKPTQPKPEGYKGIRA